MNIPARATAALGEFGESASRGWGLGPILVGIQRRLLIPFSHQLQILQTRTLSLRGERRGEPGAVVSSVTPAQQTRPANVHTKTHFFACA